MTIDKTKTTVQYTVQDNNDKMSEWRKKGYKSFDAYQFAQLVRVIFSLLVVIYVWVFKEKPPKPNQIFS